ncbi:MAG: RNA polymerase sigma factor [Phycisphaerales bacterium]
MTPLPSNSRPPSDALPVDADESSLLSGLRSGDSAAFERLVRESGPRLLAVTRRILGNDEDARDALQDAYVSALKSLDSFDGRSRITTWLHRVAVNAALMKLRSRRRRPERDLNDLLPAFESDGHASRRSTTWRPTADALSDHELATHVRARIDDLPERHRLVLLLRDIEGLDTAATAEVMGISANAVKILLHRARQALREELDPRMTDSRE